MAEAHVLLVFDEPIAMCINTTAQSFFFASDMKAFVSCLDSSSPNLPNSNRMVRFLQPFAILFYHSPLLIPLSSSGVFLISQLLFSLYLYPSGM
jgi:hypothetical protein